MSNLVCGIGFNDNSIKTRVNNSRMTYEYKVWTSMLRRCTDVFQSKRSTYKGVTCSDNFKHYSFFYEWCHRQIGFGNIDEDGKSWHLDKDLLVKGNKIYSEDTCVFLPPKLNTVLVKSNSIRGKYPLGVCRNKQMDRFLAQCKNGDGKSRYLGSFKTPEQAFQAYKTFKEACIKQVAEQYKSQIDPRAYKALLEYEVNIDD